MVAGGAAKVTKVTLVRAFAPSPVTPAKAGVSGGESAAHSNDEIPAYAGMTGLRLTMGKSVRPVRGESLENVARAAVCRTAFFAARAKPIFNAIGAR